MEVDDDLTITPPDEEFFGKNKGEGDKHDTGGAFKPVYTPIVPVPESEKSESSITSLDSDEENCGLVSSNDVKDMNFACHREYKSDYRQNKIDDYLSFNHLNSIPIGVKSLDVEVLTNLHLYLYHRLPDPDSLQASINKSKAQEKAAKLLQNKGIM